MKKYNSPVIRFSAMLQAQKFCFVIYNLLVGVSVYAPELHKEPQCRLKEMDI
jgi:hypothetical protein